MKTRLAVMCVMVAVACRGSDAVNFATSGTLGSISLDAKETATARSTESNWETTYGSYDRDFIRTKTIAIDVTRFGDTSSNATVENLSLEVIWLAQKVNGKAIFVYSWQKSGMTFEPGQRLLKTKLTMPALKSNVTNYAALGETWVSGSKVFGWIALVRDPSTGQVLRHRTSGYPVEAVIKGGSVPAMIEAYSKEIKRR